MVLRLPQQEKASAYASAQPQDILRRQHKRQAMAQKFAAFIEFDESIGEAGRFYMRKSGLPVTMVYGYLLTGLSAQEIVERVPAISMEEIDIAYEFIASML